MHPSISDMIAELNIRSNNLLANFSYSNSSILSVLLKSYSMNIYGSTLLRYNSHSSIVFLCIYSFSWRKIVRRLWKTPNRTHNSLVHLINNCDSIDCCCYIVRKEMCKIFVNLFNSNNVILSRIIRYSMHNRDTTIICENDRYFMYKYKFILVNLVGLTIFLIYIIEFIIILNLFHSMMIFVFLVLSRNCARHLTVVSHNLLTATRCVI